MAFFEKRKIVTESFSVPTESAVMGEALMGFSTPFMEIGEGSLTLPYINDNYLDARGFVRFGKDNDYPQLVNQMYYTSPINGAIIDFKTNAAVGGGYEIKPKTDVLLDQVKCEYFDKKHKLSKMIGPIARDIVMHACAYVLLTFDDAGKLRKVRRVPREEVRTSKDKKLYFLCDDWRSMAQIRKVMRYTGAAGDTEQLLCFEEESVGQRTYSIAGYTSCLNWAFLDGEMSILHKSNIQNSIFPSFAVLFSKRPNGKGEMEKLEKVIAGATGAKKAGKAIALFGNGKDEIPVISPIPTNQNDKLFEQTDERIDAQVCKAHIIDPLLMGIRVSGKLGSGNDIEKSYTIFEKNTVLPLRAKIEEIFNRILSVGLVPGRMEINNFQIINDEIVEVDNDATVTLEKIMKLPPDLQKKVIASMTANQAFALAGLPKVKGGDAIPGSEPTQQNQQAQ